jgi:hypothetical protein
VPGIGAQGGDLEATLAGGPRCARRRTADQFVARIIYAGGGAPASIRAAALELREAINNWCEQAGLTEFAGRGHETALDGAHASRRLAGLSQPPSPSISRR